MSYDVIRHSADGKAIAYIFDKMVKDNSAGHWQIGARFKGRGDREWIVIYVPSDSDHSYNGFIRLFNQEKGDIVIRPEEMAKAARLLTNFYNSPSLAGNEKRTTQSGSQASPKSVRHSAVDDDEVIDCTEDEVLEHSVTFKNVPFEYYAYSTSIGPYGLHITFRNTKKAELFDAVGDYIHLDFTKYEIYNQFTTIQKFKSGILNKFNEKVVSLRNTYGADSLMAFTKATISSQEASRAAAGGWVLITDDPNWGVPTRDKTVSSGNSRRNSKVRHSYTVISSEDELYHHGILGQKWGVRRYQNADGSLTDAGKTHYGKKKSDYQTLMSKATAARNEAADYLEKKPRSKQQKAANASMLDKADKFQKKAEKIAEDVEKKTGKKITISKEDKAAIDRVMKYYSQKSVKEINGDRALQAASGFLGGFVGSMAVASISLAAGENLVSKYKYNW